MAMKRNFIFWLIMLSVVGKTYSQVVIKEDSTVVNHVVKICPDTIWVEGFVEGPNLHGYYTLINRSPDTVVYDSEKLSFYFMLCDDTIVNEIWAFPYSKDSKTLRDSIIVIPPNGQFQLQMSTCLYVFNQAETIGHYEVLNLLPMVKRIINEIYVTIKYEEKAIATKHITNIRFGDAFFEDYGEYAKMLFEQ